MRIPRIDLHVHSQFSLCAEDVSVEGDVRTAVERGIAVIAITDHGLVERPHWLERYLEEVERVRGAYGYGVEVLTGIEADVVDGGLIVSREVLKRLDVVVASLHAIPSGVDAVEYWRRSLLSVLRDWPVAVLGHPTDAGWRRVWPPLEYVLEVLDEARSAGVAVELNYHHRDPSPDFIRAAVERGIPLCPNSDAHRLSDIGVYSWHESALRAAGVELERVKWVRLEDLLK